MTLKPVPPEHEIIILGAGLAGLSCAHHLEHAGMASWSLWEKGSIPGGKATSHAREGFVFDVTGHWLHLRDEGCKQLVRQLLGDALIEVRREARIFSHGVFTHYPFQANTFGLPQAVVDECVSGFVAAMEKKSTTSGVPPGDFHEYILTHFGAGIARHFMVPYNQKMWGVHPREITAAWCSRFVPRPTLEEVLAGSQPDEDGQRLGYNTSFVYPRTGGIGELAGALAQTLPNARIHYGNPALRINWRKREVQMARGEAIGYEQLVSTMPLPVLIDKLDDVPNAVRSARKALRWTNVAYVDYGCRGEVNRGFHWVYVPETRFPFYRVGSYSNAAPHLAPEGHGSLYVEMSTTETEPNWHALLPQVRAGLLEAGLLTNEDAIVVEEPRIVPMAYVIFDHDYYAARATIMAFLKEAGIESIGRYGRWTYGSMEDALIDGRTTAQVLCQRRA